MGFFHRKVLLRPKATVVIKDECCWFSYCSDDCVPPPPPPPPPPPNHPISPLLIFMFCLLGVAFLFIFYLTISTRYRSYLNNSRRRRNPANLDETHEDFMDEDHGPVVDHPIWLINTVGLEQSVIDSIEIFKYKRDDKLIEGTECSVCLNEFQDDESLRLLPKCSHAFHVPCIDTWLRAHKNCPLCRAPVVCDNAHLRTVDPNLNELGSTVEIPMENLENLDGGLGNHQVGENGTSEMRDETENVGGGHLGEVLEKNYRYLNATSSRVRVVSDLADHRERVDEQLEPVRRSISMNSSSASMIYFAMSNIPLTEHEGCSDTRLVLAKKPDSQKIAKGHKRSSSSIYKRVMKSSSFGRSSHKGPICMKRSYSSNGKCSQPSHSRSHDSIPPL